MLSQFKVRLKPNLTARVPIDHRLPDLQGLFLFAGVVSQFARLQQLAGSAIIDD